MMSNLPIEIWDMILMQVLKFSHYKYDTYKMLSEIVPLTLTRQIAEYGLLAGITCEKELSSLLSVKPKLKPYGDVALIFASSNGYDKIVKILLDGGADANARNNHPLMCAVEEGNTKIVKILLAGGADVHARQEHAIGLACYLGHADTVEALLDFGADVHANREDGLRCACRFGHIEIVKHLLSAGADVHAMQDEALKVASSYEHTNIVEMLVHETLRCCFLNVCNIKNVIMPFYVQLEL